MVRGYFVYFGARIAGVAKLVDAQVSEACGGNTVLVRIQSSAKIFFTQYNITFRFSTDNFMVYKKKRDKNNILTI
jgi:hypothetical protein